MHDGAIGIEESTLNIRSF